MSEAWCAVGDMQSARASLICDLIIDELGACSQAASRTAGLDEELERRGAVQLLP